MAAWFLWELPLGCLLWLYKVKERCAQRTHEDGSAVGGLWGAGEGGTGVGVSKRRAVWTGMGWGVGFECFCYPGISFIMCVLMCANVDST